MSISLIIDTTGNILNLALIYGDKVSHFLGNENARRHTSSILVEIDNLLKKANFCIRDIKNIGVIVGPGSFTGIRIGVATANALVKATGANLIEITSLEPYLINLDNGLSLIDCNHKNYYALHKKDGKSEYLAISEEEISQYSEPHIYIDKPNIKKIIECFNQKIKEKEFSKTSTPFYIKRSSAENGN